MSPLEIRSFLINYFPDIEWKQSSDSSFGLFSTNYAFMQAKAQSKNPAQIANEFCSHINNVIAEHDIQIEAKPVGAYINIIVKDECMANFFGEKRFAPTLIKENKTISVEFFSPNVAKKLHVGNIRSADIGDVIRKILQLKYQNVISINHLGDWGIQFGMLIWGIQHLSNLSLPFRIIDWENETPNEIVQKLHTIYVATNQKIEEDENIRVECGKNAEKLERYLLGLEHSKTSNFITLWQNIIEASIVDYSNCEGYLNLNRTITSENELFDYNQAHDIINYKGVWSIRNTHRDGQFDIVLGESFYIQFNSEFEYLADCGVLHREGKAVYADLEDEGLGRCYLISSQGYSLYASRDIAARFVRFGIFGVNTCITLTDNRQSHHFKQMNAVLQKIISSKVYEERAFGILTKEQTIKAIVGMQKELPIHVNFGTFSLPDGPMKSRTGKILSFEDLIHVLHQHVEKNLDEKQNSQGHYSQKTSEKIHSVSLAALKWQDLHKDREQDVIFDPATVTKFEGNTGIYQLYTYARLKNIISKNETTSALNENSYGLLNDSEKEILREIYRLPLVIDAAATTLKPHILCNFLFELCTKINSWYVANSVSNEEDVNRRDALLTLCSKMAFCLQWSLELLGIKTVESL